MVNALMGLGGLLFLLVILNGVVVNGERVKLFVFGDSTVDCGTNNYINTSMENQANYFPYGDNGFFGHPTGRFSDGRVAPDFIAELANLPLIPPYLQKKVDHSNGANFASGGAGVLKGTNEGLVVDLETQVAQFMDLVERYKIKLGHFEAKQMVSNAVYYVSIGSNDYLVGYLPDSEAQQLYTGDEFRDFVIGNLSAQIQILYNCGARKFLLSSVADLGCLPGIRALTNGTCLESATYLSVSHNTALEKLLTNLTSKLADFKYIVFDLFAFLTVRTENPQKYGFIEALEACCGTGPFRGLDTCGGKNGVAEYHLCPDSAVHMWFDAYHCTESVHRQVGQTLWEGTDNVVKPLPLKVFFDDEALHVYLEQPGKEMIAQTIGCSSQ
ncbi:hypothetical protein AMTRI_Chr13g117030 [Amborella trichopoda]